MDFAEYYKSSLAELGVPGYVSTRTTAEKEYVGESTQWPGVVQRCSRADYVKRMLILGTLALWSRVLAWCTESKSVSMWCGWTHCFGPTRISGLFLLRSLHQFFC